MFRSKPHFPAVFTTPASAEMVDKLHLKDKCFKEGQKNSSFPAGHKESISSQGGFHFQAVGHQQSPAHEEGIEQTSGLTQASSRNKSMQCLFLLKKYLFLQKIIFTSNPQTYQAASL